MNTLVGHKAANFQASAVMADGSINNNFQLHEHIRGKYGVLFFYPLDFTFVCPSELIALDRRIPQFQEKNAEVMAISIDSVFTHAAWRKTAVDAGGIGAVNYPMIADLNHSICRMYGIEQVALGVAFRAVFVIDKQGLIRIQTVHDLPIGRNIDEILRTVDALEFHAQHGEVCPAGWQHGKKGMVATTEGVAEYLAAHAKQL